MQVAQVAGAAILKDEQVAAGPDIPAGAEYKLDLKLMAENVSKRRVQNGPDLHKMAALDHSVDMHLHK